MMTSTWLNKRNVATILLLYHKNGQLKNIIEVLLLYIINFNCPFPPLSRYPTAYASENGRPQRGLKHGLRPFVIYIIVELQMIICYTINNPINIRTFMPPISR